MVYVIVYHKILRIKIMIIHTIAKLNMIRALNSNSTPNHPPT